MPLKGAERDTRLMSCAQAPRASFCFSTVQRLVSQSYCWVFLLTGDRTQESLQPHEKWSALLILSQRCFNCSWSFMKHLGDSTQDMPVIKICLWLFAKGICCLFFLFENLAGESKARRLICHVIIPRESEFVAENMCFSNLLLYFFIFAKYISIGVLLPQNVWVGPLDTSCQTCSAAVLV